MTKIKRRSPYAGMTPSERRNARLFRTLRNVVIIFFLVLNLFPLLWVFMSSFKTNREILDFALSLPAEFSIKNYIRALEEPGMIQGFLNSAIATTISVILNATVSYMAAYVISRYDFKWLKWLSLLMAFGLLVPINSALIPIKIVMDTLHLSNSILGLGILYAAIQIPMSILILEGHIGGIPKALDEAARIDGASPMRVATMVIAPIAKPGLVTVIILQAVYSWNEFLFAMTLISDQSQKTIQIIIRNFLGMFQTNYGALFASVILAIIPMVVIFMFFQNRIIEAFTSGSVK